MVPVAYFGSRGLTKPLNKMNEAAVAMTKGDFSVRAIEKETAKWRGWATP